MRQSRRERKKEGLAALGKVPGLRPFVSPETEKGGENLSGVSFLSSRYCLHAHACTSVWGEGAGEREESHEREDWTCAGRVSRSIDWGCFILG